MGRDRLLLHFQGNFILYSFKDVGEFCAYFSRPSMGPQTLFQSTLQPGSLVVLLLISLRPHKSDE